MKHHLVAAACCAALATPLAIAQASGTTAPTTVGSLLSSVTITGIADAYVGSRQLSGGTRLSKVDSSGMSTSQINFAGEKKFGDIKAEFALGMFLRPDDGGQGRFAGDTFFGRNAYVGVGGDFGTVRFGRQSTGNFLNFLRTNSFGDSSTFGPTFVHTWVSPIAQGTQFVSPGAPATSRGLTGALGTSDSAWNNSVVYISPAVQGFTGQAQWAPSEAAGVGGRTGLSGFYASGPLNLSLATEQIGAASVPASGPAAAVINRQTTWQMSGAYALGFGRISAGYINTKRDFATIIDDKISTFHVGASIPLSANGTVLVQLAQSTQTPDTGAALKRTTTSLGYTHTIFKEVDLYAVFMNDRMSNQASGNSIGLGARYRF